MCCANRNATTETDPTFVMLQNARTSRNALEKRKPVGLKERQTWTTQTKRRNETTHAQTDPDRATMHQTPHCQPGTLKNKSITPFLKHNKHVKGCLQKSSWQTMGKKMKCQNALSVWKEQPNVNVSRRRLHSAHELDCVETQIASVENMRQTNPLSQHYQTLEEMVGLGEMAPRPYSEDLFPRPQNWQGHWQNHISLGEPAASSKPYQKSKTQLLQIDHWTTTINQFHRWTVSMS